MTDQAASGDKRDLARKPVGFMIAWGLPIIILFGLGFFNISPKIKILVAGGSFAWMGAACVINAARCGRLHCYFSGPILLIGAALIILTGYDVVRLGSITPSQISYATILLALSTLALEFVWGAYVKKQSSKSEKPR